jgi:hypothetical protein
MVGHKILWPATKFVADFVADSVADFVADFVAGAFSVNWKNPLNFTKSPKLMLLLVKKIMTSPWNP